MEGLRGVGLFFGDEGDEVLPLPLPLPLVLGPVEDEDCLRIFWKCWLERGVVSFGFCCEEGLERLEEVKGLEGRRMSLRMRVRL